MSRVRVSFRTLITVSAFAAGILAVASCQQVGGEPRDAAAGLMAQAQEPSDYALHFADTGEAVKLAYGLPNSEVMSLMLDCEKGSGAIAVSDVAKGSDLLTLSSGGQSAKLSGAIEPSPMAPVVVAQTKASAPALQAFRQTGKVEVLSGDSRYGIVAGADEKQAVDQFFAACQQAA